MKPKLYFNFLLVIFYVVCFLQAAQANGPQPAGPAAKKDSVVFNYTGQPQTWVVPDGVTLLHVEAYGAQGGSEHGGKGGLVQSDLKVTPGTTLQIFVGSQPTDTAGGYNGGGNGCGKGYGGGGATDIRIGGSALDNRVLVAGGGGGCSNIYGGAGSGAGGGLTGADGTSMYNEHHVAHGGTQQAGGAGARAYFSPAGKLGTGGDGINSRGNCTNGMMCGGGGGYYGGGGGAAGSGAGGSSYTTTANSNVVHQQGVNAGNGKLVIYWERLKL